MNFGERLGEVLAMRGMTQRELAARTGVTEAAITRYRKGERDPTAKILKRMADALDCPVECLLENCEILPKTFGETIKFKTMDNSPQQMAYALCEYYKQIETGNNTALIELEELAEHILTYVKYGWKKVGE